MLAFGDGNEDAKLFESHARPVLNQETGL